MKNQRHIYFISLVSTILTLGICGCTGKISDAFQKALSFASLSKQSAIVLVSNTTTGAKTQCTESNRVVIRKSVPFGRTLYCRETSDLASQLKPGETCPGGVVVSKFVAPTESRICDQITLCGKSATVVNIVGSRTDGGSIEELVFTNLPWGCQANAEFSFDPHFAKEATESLQVYVQPPECPFCPRINKPTCEPCRDLTPDEEIISGQVVQTHCTGGVCAPCEVLHQSGEFVPHGQGKVFYNNESGACNAKCSLQSMLRICSNGLWQGDPSYEFAQCVDNPCDCKLPNDAITYTHNSSKTVFKTTQPACGVECPSQGLPIRCNDGIWQKESDSQSVSDSDFVAFPYATCSKRVCHCERPGRQIVADGQTKAVYSKGVVSCTETCDNFTGAVTCTSGTLTPSQYLNFGFDSCTQEDCGCRVNLTDGAIIIANGGSSTFYQYGANTASVPDACSNSTYQKTVNCTNKVLSAYDANIFKYKTCLYTPLSCRFTDGSGNNVTVASGQDITISKTSTPGCGVACENLTLTCQNTVFYKTVNGNPVAVTTAELSPYKSASACTLKNCDCNINGNIIPYGVSDPNFFKTDKITNCNINGCTANKATLTCTDHGPISSKSDDPYSYRYKSCEVIPCGCAVAWGGSIEDGKTVHVFNIERSTCSAPDACQEASHFKTITCNNGVLSPSYDTSVFQFPSCSPAVCDCKHGPVKTPFGQTLKVFTADTPPAGLLCSSISAIITCQSNGTWTGADLSLYPSVICTDLSDSGSGGGTGGGTGNDEGPGAAIRKRLGLADPPDGASRLCLSASECRMQVTVVSVSAFNKQACILPWGSGETEFYSSVSAFDKQCAVLPDTCTNHRTVRTCHAPSWTGENSYKFPSCVEKSSCP